MSVRVYLKDGSNVLLTAPTSAKPYPGDDNFIAGMAGDGVTVLAVIPVESCVAVQAEN